jgi:hypothetical protein
MILDTMKKNAPQSTKAVALLHPLMGRANVLINVMELIEAGDISLDEAKEMMRCETPACIVNRLSVELNIVRSYLDRADWWEKLWSAEEVKTARSWVTRLVEQTQKAIDDFQWLVEEMRILH